LLASGAKPTFCHVKTPAATVLAEGPISDLLWTWPSLIG